MLEPPYMDDLVFDAPTHTYRVKGRIVPHITEVVPSDYSHVPPDMLEAAAIRGQIVHKMTELYDLNRLDWCAIDVSLMGYLEAWVKAREEYRIEFEPVDVERRLYHPIKGYAGTGDRPRAWITPPGQRRRLSTAEIKTIATMDENVGIQTAGQQYAENYRARYLGIPETEDRWGFQLRPDGTYRAVQYTNPQHLGVFLAYLTCLKWEVNLGKKQFAVQSPNRASNGHNRNVANGSVGYR